MTYAWDKVTCLPPDQCQWSSSIDDVLCDPGVPSDCPAPLKCMGMVTVGKIPVCR